MKKLYQIIDNSNPEAFYPLGLFETKEEAISKIKEASLRNEPISEFTDMADSTHEIIAIQVLRIGWDSDHEIIYELEREQVISVFEEEWKTIREDRM